MANSSSRIINRRHYPTRILAMVAALVVVSLLLPYLAYRNYLEELERSN